MLSVVVVRVVAVPDDVKLVGVSVAPVGAASLPRGSPDEPARHVQPVEDMAARLAVEVWKKN